MADTARDEPLTCASCNRRYRWRSDYRSVPCPVCGGRVYAAADLPADPPAAAERPEPAASSSPPAVRRWLGDAEVGGRPLGRVFDAGCYAAAGTALVVAALADSDDALPAWLPLVGAAGVLYGLRIFLTEGSYWVSTWVYVIAFFAVAFAVGGLG